MIAFYQGLEIRYKDHVGFVDFMCDQYITICLKQLDHRSRDVCILIYPSQWKEIQLLEQSEK